MKLKIKKKNQIREKLMKKKKILIKYKKELTQKKK